MFEATSQRGLVATSLSLLFPANGLFFTYLICSIPTKGFYNLQSLSYLALAVTVAGLDLFFGGKIHTALGRATFVRLNSVLLLGSGAALLKKA